MIDWWRRADSAAHGLALDLGLYGLSAVFAGITAVSSSLQPHRAWGAIAVWGYLAAALATGIVWYLAGHILIDRAVVTVAAWIATALVPLGVLASRRQAQEEVVVVELAGERLLDTGTPYLGRDAIAALPEPLLGYLPYQPGMALFGIPRGLAGDAWWTDARVWFALATAAALIAAVALLPREPPLIRAVQAATVLPLCALTLATGGDDMPVLALCLLAFAFAARDRLGAAGLAIGVAGALKLFAWPVALVLAVHAISRNAGGRFIAGAVGLPVLALIPAVLVDPGAAVENVLAYPLGRGLVTSPAQSPFPGHLIAEGLPGGRAIAAALLVATATAIAAGLLRRPPRTAADAALWSAAGLLAAILLMPSTRFGYLLYPVAFILWIPALRRPVAYT